MSIEGRGSLYNSLKKPPLNIETENYTYLGQNSVIPVSPDNPAETDLNRIRNSFTSSLYNPDNFVNGNNLSRPATSLILETHKIQNELNVDLSNPINNFEAIQRLLIETTASHTDTFPDYLHHEGQVNIVTDNIARMINPVNPEENQFFDHEKEKNKAKTFALLHDYGRRVTNRDPHAIMGSYLLNVLKVPKNYADFAYVHHRGGLGPTECPPFLIDGLTPNQAIESIVSNTSQEQKTLLAEDILNGNASHSIEGQNLELISDEIAHYIQETFGAAGMAALVGDWSKNYPTPSKDESVNIHMPVIAEFDLEVAKSLFARQINKFSTHEGQKGGYAEGSIQHFMDLSAALAVTKIINILETDYNVNYSEAIQNAQCEWPKEREKIQNIYYDYKNN